MRLILTIFLVLLGSSLHAEIVKLKCKIVNPTALEKKLLPPVIVEFDTSRKTVKIGKWPTVKVARWDDKKIVWYNEDDNTAIVSVYDIAKDMVLTKAIHGWDFEPHIYDRESKNKPSVCYRSNF